MEEQVVAKATNMAEQQRHRSGCKAHVNKKEGLMSNDILEGSHFVPDLKDSVDTIGPMKIVCPDCGAFKFKKETGSTCCSNGKVYIEPLPKPPTSINKLWHDDTPEGRLFRQNALIMLSVLQASKASRGCSVVDLLPALFMRERLLTWSVHFKQRRGRSHALPSYMCMTQVWIQDYDCLG